MILRSRAAGVVVKRSVVRGNYYTSADLLMTIAPLDHLWVRGSVSELDADKVEVGPEAQDHLSFLRSNHRRQGRIHRQGDRCRLSVRQVPHLHPQSPGPAQGRHVRAGFTRGPAQPRSYGDPSLLDGVGRSTRLRFHQEAWNDRHLRTSQDFSGQEKATIL